MLDAFYCMATGQIENQRKLIEGWCPARQHLKDTILEHPDVITALLNNDNYGKISPAVTKLRKFLDMARRVGRDGHGPILNSDIYKAALDHVALGTDTVCMTFAVFHVKKITKISNVKIRSPQAKSLKDQMASMQFDVGKCILDFLGAVCKPDFRCEEEGAAASSSDLAGAALSDLAGAAGSKPDAA